MKVWLVKIGEPVPTLGPNQRLLRMGLLAERLAARGHETVWWTSDFDHISKQDHFGKDCAVRVHDNYTIEFLNAPGYQRNVSLRRFVNHALLARKFRTRIEALDPPDVIVSALPTPDLCEAAARYGRQRHVPVVIDTRDKWPDVIADNFRGSIGPLAEVLVAPMRRTVKKACSAASSLTATSEEFLQWALALAERERSSNDRVFPLGHDPVVPPDSALQEARDFWRRHGIVPDDDRFTVCYFGVLGAPAKYTLNQVIEAARTLEQRHDQFRFVFCGSGDGLEAFRRAAGNCETVLFPGWVGSAQLWALLRTSHVGLVPYHPRMMEGSLPNKVADYFSAGLPVLSSLDGSVGELLRTGEAGAVFTSAQDIVRSLTAWRGDPASWQQMSFNARRMFEQQFVADAVYGRMIDHLETIAQASLVRN